MAESVCKKCGRTNDSGFSYCPDCGEKFQDEPVVLKRYILDDGAPLGAVVPEKSKEDLAVELHPAKDKPNNAAGNNQNVNQALRYPWTLIISAPILILYYVGVSILAIWLVTQQEAFSAVSAAVMLVFLVQSWLVVKILLGHSASRYWLTGSWLVVSLGDMITEFNGLKLILFLIVAIPNVLIYLPRTNSWFTLRAEKTRIKMEQ